MKKQFKKNILSLTMIAVVSIFSGYTIHRNHQNRPELSEFGKANIEALAGDESSGAKCPAGCKDIGWGTHKILQCDCNYDQFSSCDNWGC